MNQKCQSTGQKHIYVDNLFDIPCWWDSSLSGEYCRCGVQNYAVAVRGWSHQPQPPPRRPGNYFNLHKVNWKWVPIESKIDTLSFMRWEVNVRYNPDTQEGLSLSHPQHSLECWQESRCQHIVHPTLQMQGSWWGGAGGILQWIDAILSLPSVSPPLLSWVPVISLKGRMATVSQGLEGGGGRRGGEQEGRHGKWKGESYGTASSSYHNMEICYSDFSYQIVVVLLRRV